MEELELDSKPKNKFYEVINPHYGKLFQEVYDSDISSRDEKMQKLYDESKEDKGLSEEKKKLISLCMIAYKNAVCDGNICGVLVYYSKHKSLNLNKFIGKRFPRIYDDLITMLDKIGFEFRPELLPELIQYILATYDKGSVNQDIDRIDVYPMILLSRFARVLSPSDYKDMWFCAMFMKNISSVAYVSKELLDTHPNIKNQRENLFKLFVYLDSKYKLKDDEEKKDEEKSTSL